MDLIQNKFPFLPPEIILQYLQKCKSVEETISFLEILFDKKRSSYVQYDISTEEEEYNERARLKRTYKNMIDGFPELSEETIRIIVEKSDFNYKKSVQNAQKISDSYKQIKSEKNPKIKDLFDRIQDITNELEIDELTFLIKINGSNLHTTIISLGHYKRLIQLIDKFLMTYNYSPDVELSDDEWDVWGEGNTSDSDDDESDAILNPFNRLQYLFPIFDQDEIRTVYFYDAKENYGVAHRILRERKLMFGMSMEFPSATNEEIKDAIQKANGDEREVAKIILLNKIENPVIEETLLALRPDLTMDQARKVISQAKNPNDARELLNISNAIFPINTIQKVDLNYGRSQPIQTRSFEEILEDEENEELKAKNKKVELFSKAINKQKSPIKIDTSRNYGSSQLKSLIIQKKQNNENEAPETLNIPLSIKARRNISLKKFGPTLTLDLHGMRKPECQWYIENVLEATKNSKYSKINFITGKGKHSVNKVPILRPLVMEISDKKGFKSRLLDENPGVVQVEL